MTKGIIFDFNRMSIEKSQNFTKWDIKDSKKGEVMNIQFLYFAGCPSYKQGLENLKQALKELDLPEDFEMLNIDTDEKAKEYQFIGSPTIRINGKDIDPKAREAEVTGYRGCRIYQTEKGIQGAPTVEIIKTAIQSNKGQETLC